MVLPDASKLPRSTLLAAICVALIAGALRFWQAGESLWIDELHSAWCAGGDLAEVAPRAASGNQSPLFFWWLWLLVQVLGASEWTLRLPSLIAGSILPLALFGLVWRWTHSGVSSLTAALLATVDHWLIFYATEARPYALVQLLAVIHVAITAELVDRPTAWLRVAWVLLAAVLFHLHYTAALLLVAEAAFWCLARVAGLRGRGHRLSSAVVDASIVVLLCLPAAENLRNIFARRENWAAFVEAEPLWRMVEWFPWSLLAPFAVAGAIIGAKQRRFVGLALAWFVVPAVVAWLTTAFDVARLFFPRYLVATAPAAMVLAALCVDLAPWRMAQALLAGLLALVAVGESGIAAQLRLDGRVIADRNEDWRGAMQFLNEQHGERQFPVLVASGLIEGQALRSGRDPALEEYCLFPVTSLYPLAAPRKDLVPLPLYDRSQLLPARGCRGAWLIVRGSRQTAEAHQNAVTRSSGLRQLDDEWWAKPTLRKSFGNVQVILLTSDR